MNASTPNSVKGYELIEQLGEGAFGAVYRARQEAVGREVAVKVILPQYANSPEFIRRFEVEAHTIALLEHPYITPLYDYWRDPEGAYLVMRLMSDNLADRLAIHALTSIEFTRIIEQICSALAFAHRRNIVHRDLKPANILLDEEGNAYLSDFGIAKDLDTDQNLTGTGAIIGSPGYLSPEQVRSELVTPQADIYALGVMVYEMAAGEHPFPDTPTGALLLKHVSDPLPRLTGKRPDLPVALDEIIQRATAKDPTERYATAVDFIEAFRRVMGGELPEDDRDLYYPADLANPYKGLRAFEEGDAADFFGREKITGRLLARMLEPAPFNRFLAVVGPSGSGKSSLVKAGFLPALRSGGLPGSENWYVVGMTPGVHPFEELEYELQRLSSAPQPSLLSLIRENERGFLRAARRVLPEGAELLIFIDQFEELFTLVQDASEAAAFLDQLYASVAETDGSVRILITLRADFYAQPLMHPDFSALLQERTEVVVPLKAEELGLAVQSPADRAGVKLEENLLTRIVADVAEQPGALPLLQYALTELFERRQGRVLSMESYEQIGGVLGALGKRAEDIYRRQSTEGQELARQIFLRLVTLGEGYEDTRRRVLMTELAGLGQHVDIQEVLEKYGRFRLLTFDLDPVSRTPTIEVAHEALLRDWPRLRTWLDESRADVRMQRVLGNAAAEWQAAGQDVSFLLRGSRLDQYDAWMESTGIQLTMTEKAFLEASLAERSERQQMEADRQMRERALEARSRRALRVIVMVMVTAAVVATGLSFFAFNQQGIARAEADGRATQQALAEDAQEEAENQAALALTAQAEAVTQAGIAAANEREALAQKAIVERQAELNQIRFLVSQSQFHLQARNFDLALALAQAALQMNDPPLEAELAFSDAAYSSGITLYRQFVGHEDEIEDAVISPDGLSVWSISLDNTIRQWDLQTGEEIRRLEIPEGGIDRWFGGALSADARFALVGLKDFRVLMLDLETNKPIHIMEGHNTGVTSIKISPDGRTALTGDDKGLIILWDLVAGKEIRRYIGHREDDIREMVFFPDGSKFLSGSFDNSAILWNLETGEILHRMQTGNPELVEVVAVLPDARQALVSSGFYINLWNLETGQMEKRFGFHNTWPIRMSLSPDGLTAVSSDASGDIRVWDLAEERLRFRFKAHAGVVTALSFSPDGQYLISGAEGDNKLKIWSLKHGAEVQRFVHADMVRGVAFSPDGSRFISIEGPGTLHLRDLESGKEILEIVFTPDLIGAWDAAFAPDGKTVLVGFDGDVVAYDLDSGEEVRRFGGESDQDGHIDIVDAIVVMPGGKRILTGSQNPTGTDRNLFLWDLETGQILQQYKEAPNIFGLDVHPDGNTALLGGTYGVIELDLQTGEELRRLTGHEEISVGVWQVAYSPDGRMALDAAADGTLFLWDLERGEIVHHLKGHLDFVRAVAFHPDGRTAVSGSRDGVVILWDLVTGAMIRCYLGHNAQINDIAFSPDGRYVLSSDSDGVVIQWRIDNTLEELLAWVESNRNIPKLTCAERVQFNIEPLCEGDEN